MLLYSFDSILADPHELEDEDALAEDDGEKSGENPATSGSRGAAYGGGNELFQSQFQLHTVQQKLNQIVLLQVSKIKQRINVNKLTLHYDNLFCVLLSV